MRVLFFIMTACLLSCRLGPDFQSPSSPAVSHYLAKPLPIKTAESKGIGSGGKSQYFLFKQTIPSDWWTLFHSRELNVLILKGLENNQTLASALATLRKSQETFNMQWGTSLFPSVSGSLGASRQKISDSSYGFGNNSSLFNLYDASVNVNYTLDVFGAERRQLEALRAQIDEAQYQLIAAYLTLTANIVTTSITAASLREQINATNSIIKEETQQLTILKKQFQLGGISKADVLSQETQLSQTRATVPALEKALAQSMHALAVLIGEFPSEAKLPNFKLHLFNLPKNLPISLPSVLVRQRPDIQSAEALLHVANANVGVATANLFPQITLSGNYGWTNSLPNELFHSSSSVWGFGGQLLQPLFNGGSLRAAKREAIAALDVAYAQYKQTVLTAFQNVADVLRALETDAEQLKAETQAEQAARGSLRLAEQQFKLGSANYLSLLTAEQMYQQARINRIQIEASRYTDTAALFQAVGGGWWDSDYFKTQSRT